MQSQCFPHNFKLSILNISALCECNLDDSGNIQSANLELTILSHRHIVLITVSYIYIYIY